MKTTICKIEYDTDTAELIEKFTYGSYGSPDGYEETLYVTEQGNYFMYGFGGPDSPYPEEVIKRIAKAKVPSWLDAHR